MAFNGLPPEADIQFRSNFDPVGAQAAVYGNANGGPRAPTGPYANPTAAKELFNADIQANQLVNAANATAAQDTAQGEAYAVTAQGNRLEANSYLKAGQVADQNQRLTRASTGIQQYQQDVRAENALGGQAADIAGAGFGGGATAMYLARSSHMQASLARGLTGLQGEITAGGFEQQSLASQAQADAANTAASAADIMGAAATAAGGTAVTNATRTASDLRTNALNSALALTNGTVGGRSGGGFGTGFGGAGIGGGGGGGGFQVVNHGATGDAADRALGGTLNLDPTGAGLL